MKMPDKDLIMLGWHHASFIMEHKDDKQVWDEQATILRNHAKECQGC